MLSEMYLCELCQRKFIEEAYLKHLDTHSPEEVRMLKRLTELELENKERYDDLCWRLIKMEYSLRQEVDME